MARVLRLLQLLQSRGKWNANEIARTLECSVRTVYRDLGILELAGIPFEFVKAEGCYRILQDGFKFPVLNVTDEDTSPAGEKQGTSGNTRGEGKIRGAGKRSAE